MPAIPGHCHFLPHWNRGHGPLLQEMQGVPGSANLQERGQFLAADVLEDQLGLDVRHFLA